jgi:hypothetical protein
MVVLMSLYLQGVATDEDVLRTNGVYLSLVHKSAPQHQLQR